MENKENLYLTSMYKPMEVMMSFGWSAQHASQEKKHVFPNGNHEGGDASTKCKTLQAPTHPMFQESELSKSDEIL